MPRPPIRKQQWPHRNQRQQGDERQYHYWIRRITHRAQKLGGLKHQSTLSAVAVRRTLLSARNPPPAFRPLIRAATVRKRFAFIEPHDASHPPANKRSST